jgi:hypothetical protein
MSEEILAANADAQDTSESPASSEAPVSQPQGQEVQTETQRVAQRIKEATERASKESYERAKTEIRQQARDEYIKEQGIVWKGKPITTEAEYKQALKEQQLEEQYKASGVPDEIINKVVELDKFREEALAEKKVREEQEAKAKAGKEYETRKISMYDEFAEDFPDLIADQEKLKTIPREVYEEAEKWLNSGGKEGRRLSDAYSRHLKKQEALVSKNLEASEKNAQAAAGSVRSKGKAETPLTDEMVANMTPQELAKRWPEVRKLYNMK